MLCCLKASRSQAITSRQVNWTPSIRFTTIRTYDSIGEAAKLDSSSTTPSSRGSTVTGDASLVSGAPGYPLADRGAGGVPWGSRSGCGRMVGGTWLRWRRPLSRFFFAFPATVW